MNLFALSGLLNFLSSLIFGFFVFFQDRKNRAFQFWLAFSLSVALWEFGAFRIGLIADRQTAFIWWRIAHIGVVLIPVFFTQFIYAWLGIKRKIFFYFSWTFGLFFSAINLYDLLVRPTGLFIANMRWVFNSFYYDSPPGSLYPIFTFLWFFLVLYAHYELLKIYKDSIGTKRVQIQYFLFAFAVAYAGGATSFLPVFGLDFYPYFNFTAPFYPILMSYAILRHRLLNIKVIATELLIVAIIIILFINVFTASNFNFQLLNIGILVAVSFFGYLLIKSVLREVRQREEIQRLAGSLEEANKRLVKLDKEKSEFLSIATHQLRTPMTVVKGYISMIFEGAFGQFSQEAKEALAKVYTSNERLIKLIDDLLNISRIERGKMEYDFQELALEKLVGDVVTELRPVAERKKLKIIWQPASGLPKVKFDEGKMRQVILNLIDNAIKYTEKGEIELKLEQIDKKLRLSIKDTGQGIEKEKIPLLFKRYSRLASGKSLYANHTQGMGLGLYVAKRIIDDHKGKIWAESQGPGKGSAFFVELPIG